MNLSLQQIRAITCGAISVEQSPDGIRFYRFTQEQSELYKKKKEASYAKTKATAGVKLSFRTDSRYLRFKALFAKTCLRTFLSVDVFVNGQFLDQLDNYSHTELPALYNTVELALGEFEKRFDLGEGEKTVVVHLPWNAEVALQVFELDDGAKLEPVKPSKTLLAFGDSITQGFDALRPSQRYISRLAEALDAQEYNKAIGGEFFYAPLGATVESFEPDYVVIAYGTNDWRYSSRDGFVRQSSAFIQGISNSYPNAKIFVISPVWRRAYKTETAFSSFFEIDELLRETAKDLDNVTVIRGFDFVPKDVSFFSDGGLHPTNEGFAHYFENLWQEIKELI